MVFTESSAARLGQQYRVFGAEALRASRRDYENDASRSGLQGNTDGRSGHGRREDAGFYGQCLHESRAS